MEYEDALSVSMRQVWRERRKRLAKISLKNLKKRQKTFVEKIGDFFNRFKEKASNLFSTFRPDPEYWIHERLAKPPLNQSQIMNKVIMKAEVDVDRGDDTAVFNNPEYPRIRLEVYDEVSCLSRARSWVTGAAVRIDAKTGKHKNLHIPDKNNTNRAKLLIKELAGISSLVGTASSNDSNINDNNSDLLEKRIKESKSFEKKAIDALSKWPKIPESWVCGGVTDGVVAMMRVIDQEDIVPRGGPIIEIIAGLGAADIRSSFHSKRPLCDDDMMSFASYTSIRNNITRYLSTAANKRLRYTNPLKNELPSVDIYYAAVLSTIYESRHSYSEAKQIIAKIQGMLRIRRARARIKFLKDAISRKLLQEALAGANSDDSDDDDDDDDDHNESNLDKQIQLLQLSKPG